MGEPVIGSFILDSEDQSSFKSRQLPSSMRATSSLRRSATQVYKAYQQASTLFLTRRFSESLSILNPLLTSPSLPDEGVLDEGAALEPAPIENADRRSRIRVWSLYLTLLNSIIELGPEDGKAEFGSNAWKSIVSKVQDGTIWEEVVQIGYHGAEGDVDAEVVSNLATLLLAQSPSQKTNQQRLETYLSASSPPAFLDDGHCSDPSNENDESSTNSRSLHVDDNKKKTSNPRDLASRIKILELYALHVLPRNEEWDYAREFILLSGILDEETREAFLRSLASLRHENENHREREQSLQWERDKQGGEEEEGRGGGGGGEEKAHAPPTDRKPPEPILSSTTTTIPTTTHHQHHHHHLNSEKDYGIDSPNPSPAPPLPPPSKPNHHPHHPHQHSKTPDIPPSSSSSPPSSKIQPLKPSSSPPSSSSSSYYHQTLTLLRALHHLVTRSISNQNPLSILRFVLFLLGFILALSRRGRGWWRVRLRRGWEMLRQTAGMGVRVTYI